MRFDNYFPLCSSIELKEMVANHNLFFFPLKNEADVIRFNNLNPFQYSLKIDIYLFVMNNVN